MQQSQSALSDGMVARPWPCGVTTRRFSGGTKVIAVAVLLMAIFAADFIGAIAFVQFGPSVASTVRGLREGLILLAFTYAVFALVAGRSHLSRGIVMPAICFGCFVFIYGLSALAKNIPFDIMFSSAELLLLPVILLFIGYALTRTKADYAFHVKLIIAFCVCTALFGMWDIQHTEFWAGALQYGRYLNVVKHVTTGFDRTTFLPWNFTGYEGVRRAAGLLAAPLAQGMVLAYGCTLSVALLRGRNLPFGVLLAALFFFGVFQSGTRGAMIVALLAMGIVLARSRKGLRNATNAAVGSLLAISAVQLLSPVYRYTFNLSDPSAAGHHQALLSNLGGLGRVLLFGDGVGSSGALASLRGAITTNAGEGGLFTVAYALGVPGVLAFIWLYLALSREMMRDSNRGDAVVNAAFHANWAFGIAFVTTFFTSEHAFSLSGSGAFWLMSGVLIKTRELHCAYAPRMPSLARCDRTAFRTRRLPMRWMGLQR